VACAVFPLSTNAYLIAIATILTDMEQFVIIDFHNNETETKKRCFARVVSERTSELARSEKWREMDDANE
jgi:hypothetical protein